MPESSGASPIDGGTILVTGASSGIGRSIAQQVAHRARRLVLVARRKDRLDALAEDLKSKHAGLAVSTFSCDVSDRAAVAGFVEEVRSGVGDIDVIVNNAGLGDLGVFERSRLEKQLFLVDVNIAALVTLTHAFLPGMVQRGKGAVLMISSGFGLSYLPGVATYAGTKHFVTGFTEALHCELAGTGVFACQICPGPVATEFEENMGNFTGKKVPAMLEISPDRCAREAIAAVDRRRALVVPHLFFKFVIWLSLRSPRWITRFFMRILGKRVRAEQLAKASG
ncbi:MAG: SDR family oxidoreductase [Polyangiaceae bacterium]|nr:SDR family oxidoreductase [Polyangiaceae bacterium]